MTLWSFQRALADLVASPALCRAARGDAASVLDHYDLTARERHRLEVVVRQPGMVVTGSLYRANRLSPLAGLLPLTCNALGDRLKEVVDDFWAESRDTDLQFRHEIDRFGEYLRRRLRAGDGPAVIGDILGFELAMRGFRYLSRRRIAAALEEGVSDRSSELRLHPLIRAVPFRHPPVELLNLLKHGVMPPFDLPAGDHWVLLDWRDAELALRHIDPPLGRVLLDVATSGVGRLSRCDLDDLLELGFVVPIA